MRKILLLSAAVLLISSCATDYIFVCPEEHPEPTLPTLTEEQDASIRPDVYEVLDEREVTLKADNVRLRKAIRDCHEQ